MKFACPASQNRELLKCGNIDSGSAIASEGAVTGLSVPGAGLPPFGGAVGCCACAGSVYVAVTVSDDKTSSVLAAQRIDLRFRLLISPYSPIHSIGLVSQENVTVRSEWEPQSSARLAAIAFGASGCHVDR